jgi:hypothetical protein
MNDFDVRFGDLLDFASHVGWDGYSSCAVVYHSREKAKELYNSYKLYNRECEMSLQSTGAITIHASCLHGNMEITVDVDIYYVDIYCPTLKKNILQMEVKY